MTWGRSAVEGLRSLVGDRPDHHPSLVELNRRTLESPDVEVPEGQVDLHGHTGAVKRAARQSIRAFPNIDRIVILDGTVH